MISPTMTLVLPSPTVRTVPALVLLPALFHLYHVAFQQELLHSMSTPLLSKLLNSGTVCPQRLWTKMLLLYQHSRVHSALSLIRFQICHPLVSQESTITHFLTGQNKISKTDFVVGVRCTQTTRWVCRSDHRAERHMK